MKRLLTSLACGLALPFLIACVTGPLSAHTEDRAARLLLDLPTGWPRILYFQYHDPFARDLFSDNDAAFFLFIVGCDALLYAALTYGALIAFPALRRKKVDYGEPPPPPARF